MPQHSMDIFSPNPLHVLLVEDNAVALHIIETLATQAGLRFTSAKNGEHALDLVKSQVFDLIITDIGLPGISGYELTQAIRQWEKDSFKNPTPIVGLTALWEAKEECLRSGMNHMISKPINLKILKELMHQYVTS